MKKIARLACLGISILSFLQTGCENLDLTDEAEVPVPSAGTVTLRIQAPGASDTKTYLENDGRVTWDEGDIVEINGQKYEVVPDSDNPAFATVYEVEASDSYLAAYMPYLGGLSVVGDGTCVVMTINGQAYRENSFGKYANAMVAYSETPELKFYNLSGVLKLPVTGNGERLKTVCVTGNGDEYLSGYMAVDMRSLVNGSPEILLMPDLAPSMSYKEITVDCGADGIELTSDPTAIYVAMPPAVYSSGISVMMETVDGKVAVQKTGRELAIDRSRVVEMREFPFTECRGLGFQLTEASSASLKYTVTGEPDITVRTMVIFRSFWDRLVGDSPDSTIEDFRNFYFSNIESVPVCTLDGTGSLEVEASKAYGSDGFSDMTAETDYIILSVYAAGEKTFGWLVSEASTAVAYGELPVLAVAGIDLPETQAFKMAALNVRSEGAASIRTCCFSKMKYDELLRTSTDKELINAYGWKLTDIELEEALSLDGHVRYFTGLTESTEYVLLAMAVSETGATTIETVPYMTSSYLPEGSDWISVTDNAVLSCGMFPTLDLALDIGGVTVYKNTHADIFKVMEPFSVLEESLPKIGWGVDSSREGYFLVDARNPQNVIVERNTGISSVHDGQYYMQLLSKNVISSDGSGDVGTYDAENGVIDLGDLVFLTGRGYYPSVGHSVLYLHPVTETKAPVLSLEAFRSPVKAVELQMEMTATDKECLR